MKYETFEGDFFFGHRVWLDIKENRIQELDEHLQTYGRRSIDWEIDSQVRKKKDNHLFDMRQVRPGRFHWNPTDVDYSPNIKDHIRFKRKSDAVRFKLSWDECDTARDEREHTLALKSLMNTYFGKFTSSIGVGKSIYSTIQPFSGGLEPLRWVSRLDGIGVNLDGQYELDFDGKIAENRNAKIRFLDDDFGSVYKDLFILPKKDTVSTKYTVLKNRQSKGRAIRPMTNPCAEIDLSQPDPARVDL